MRAPVRQFTDVSPGGEYAMPPLWKLHNPPLVLPKKEREEEKKAKGK
jgi:hypothetical protein